MSEKTSASFITVTVGLAAAVVVPGCGSPRSTGADEGGPTSADGVTAGDPGGSADGESESSGVMRLDVATPETQGIPTGGAPSCVVVGDMNGFTGCEEQSPPDSFDPEIQWSFLGEGPTRFSLITPLVANLTDDNDDGAIDLCDTPDVVLVTLNTIGAGMEGRVVVLDGGEGTVHWETPSSTVIHARGELTPAIGDIDDDGVPEVLIRTGGQELVALNHDGSELWRSPGVSQGGAIALGDMDNDGDVEIVLQDHIYDHLGNLAAAASGGIARTRHGATPVLADLDDDGDLELILSDSAFHHDGTLLWQVPGATAGWPQVADLDDDGLPEVLVTTWEGMTLFEHDGTIVYKDLTPTGDPVAVNNWDRPAAMHDVDGDGQPEILMSSADHFAAIRGDGTVLWQTSVLDQSGIATGTAFDFLGDGTAEALYGDESLSMVFDGATGAIVLRTPRTSRTIIEHPVVADIDNDGSAEILVTASDSVDMDIPPSNFTLQAVRDRDDRWIQARRIWNQHTYHVTNVREDGTIPQFERPHWKDLNTFRTNAQIENGSVCRPPVAG